ncbi:MAG: hypothetical protein QOI66_435, partial [Myxococcales bacterium]|nr:hypothetical protein [Myxococcales bacterium]
MKSRLLVVGFAFVAIVAACDAQSSSGPPANVATGTGGSGGAGGPPGSAGFGGQVDPTPACGPGDQPAPVAFRVDLPEGVTRPLPQNGMSTTYDALGTLLSVEQVTEPCVTPCLVPYLQYTGACPNLPEGRALTCEGNGVPAVRFAVQERLGRNWTITASPKGVVGEWDAAVREALGKPVSLRVRYRTGFQNGVATGFVLNDDNGLVLASDGGLWINGFETADVPSANVTWGDRICHNDCS